MSSAKLSEAQKLIKQKRYDEARAILQTINHPMALDLIDEIDKKVTSELQQEMLSGAPQPQKSKRGSRSCLTVVLAVFGCIILVGGLALFGSNASGPTSTPTITFTPSITLTPSITFTPTDTPTVTVTSTATPTPTVTPTPTASSTLSATDIAQTRSANATATREDVIAGVTATAEMLNETRTQAASDKAAAADAAAQTATFIASHKPIARGELLSYADKHMGEDVVVRGRVFNIIDDHNLQIWLIGSYDAIYVTTAEPLSGVYKDDAVIIYGTVAGYAEGSNTFGSSVKMPELADSVVIKQ